MKTGNKKLSEIRLKRLRAQGYMCQSDEELSEMAFGIRFAYRTCVSIIVVAMLTQSLTLFTIMLCIAFLGVILPNHPFDYVYNFALAKRMKKPKLPPRCIQLKFACTIATLWLASTVYFLFIGHTVTAMILAGSLAITASLPSTIDYCVPSVIYNALFQRKAKKASAKAF